MNFKKSISLFIFFTFMLLTACSVKNDTSKKKSVSVDGSTSVEKVIGILGESFTNEHPDISFTYNPTGSSSGINAVLEDRCDIGLSSRPLKDEELSKGLTSTILAYDGIAIIINNSNPVSDLSLEDVASIYKGNIKNWSEIGGSDAEIVLIGREAGSGTREAFETISITKDLCQYRQELTSTGDIITAVSQNPNAIGYASISSVKDNVKKISINGILPTEETIKDTSYAFQRPFLLVTKKDKALSDTAQSFFDYIISDKVNELIKKTGAIPPN